MQLLIILTLITLIISIIAIVVYKLRYIIREKEHPSNVICNGEEAYVYIYETGRSTSDSEYKEYKFVNKNGKWKYEHVISIKFMIVICIVLYLYCAFIGYISDTDYWWAISLFFPGLLLEFYFFEHQEAESFLTKYLAVNGLIQEPYTRIENEEYEAKLKKSTKTALTVRFIIWFLATAMIFVPFIVVVCGLFVHVICLILGKDDGMEMLSLGSAFLGFTFLSNIWVMHSNQWIFRCFDEDIPWEESGKLFKHISTRIKYAPERLAKRLANNRCNVILLSDKAKNWQVRIYGGGEKHVVEVRIGEKDDLQTYHMIDLDPIVDETSIMPVTDNSVVSIENKWLEQFRVRKSWLMDNKQVIAFLQKFYECRDLHETMKCFSFENTTKVTKKLIEEDAYVVPQDPVDYWPFINMGSELYKWWRVKRNEKLQRATHILTEEF